MMNEYPEDINKRDLLEGYIHFFKDVHFVTFHTLTFREDVPEDMARKKFRYLIRCLNRDAFGNSYTQKVGHSYFSYCCAMEYQKRGVVHFHALFDNWVNYQLLDRVWATIAGFSSYSHILPKKEVPALIYALKYVIKNNDIDTYIYKGSIKLPYNKAQVYYGMGKTQKLFDKVILGLD